MRVLLQRVREARVLVEGRTVGSIGLGLLALVGIGRDDAATDVDRMASRVLRLRVFDDDEGRMNRDVLSVGGQILSVSQFTLYADAAKGRRPSFSAAAPAEVAEPLWERFNQALAAGGASVEVGVFGAEMAVELVNWGPVTIWLDSRTGS
jgi:D-tyrosyl-tRNA(Tyr) deacylase